MAEQERGVALLISLPPSYDTVVTTLGAKGDNLTLVFVQQAVVNEEQKRQATKGGAATGNSCDSALQVDKRNSCLPFKGRCYKCRKEGHKASECPEKRPSSSHRHRLSHSAKTADEEEEGSELFVMTAGQVTGVGIRNNWILDSGV